MSLLSSRGSVLALCLAVLGLGSAPHTWALFESLFPNNRNGFVQPKHAPGVEVADFARHDLPRIRMGERTLDLTSGVNFVSYSSNPRFLECASRF